MELAGEVAEVTWGLGRWSKKGDDNRLIKAKPTGHHALNLALIDLLP